MGLAGTSSLSADEKRVGLNAVLESDTFSRCDQLRSFLKFVGEMAIEGRSREVTEYMIAVEALGRPAGFSPSDDSSVRSRAHELRRRLQKYYDTEDPGSTLRIDLPKGSYIPRFIVTEAEARPAVLQPAPAEIEEPRKVRPEGRGWPLWVGAAVAILCAMLAWSISQGGRTNSVLQEAWGPLLKPGANVLVCVATPLHMVVRPYMSVVAEGLPKYPAPEPLYPIYRQHRPLAAHERLDMHPVDNSIQFGQMRAVITLAGVLHTYGETSQVLPERSAPIAAVRGRNAILIGDPQDSSVAAELLQKTPLTIDYDPAVQDLVVRNRRQNTTWIPKRGTDKRYTDAFGLITVLPSPGARANQRIVILSGITSVGSEGAAEFFSSPKEMLALRKAFEKQGLRGFPVAYQIVVRCQSNDTQLVSEAYEAHAVVN